jgi:hypothetical protein
MGPHAKHNTRLLLSIVCIVVAALTAPEAWRHTVWLGLLAIVGAIWIND